MSTKAVNLQVAFLLFIVVIFSCDNKDDPAPTPVTVNFPADLNGAVSIDEGQIITPPIKLSFTEAAPADGSIQISYPSEGYFDRFVTDPSPGTVDGSTAIVTIPVTQGQTEVDFKFGTIDNEIADGDLSVKLTLQAAGEQPVAIPGSNSELIVNIIDDEVPVPIGFDARLNNTDINKSEGSVSFSVQAPDFVRIPGSVKVSITSSVANYNIDYTTTPDGSSGDFQLDYKRGWTNDVFILKLLQDSNITEPYQMTFTLSEHSGGVVTSNDATLLNEITITIIPD